MRNSTDRPIPTIQLRPFGRQERRSDPPAAGLETFRQPARGAVLDALTVYVASPFRSAR